MSRTRKALKRKLKSKIDYSDIWPWVLPLFKNFEPTSLEVFYARIIEKDMIRKGLLKTDCNGLYYEIDENELPDGTHLELDKLQARLAYFLKRKYVWETNQSIEDIKEQQVQVLCAPCTDEELKNCDFGKVLEIYENALKMMNGQSTNDAISSE